LRFNKKLNDIASDKNALWLDLITLSDYERVGESSVKAKLVHEWKLKTIRKESTRRPEHKYQKPNEYYSMSTNRKVEDYLRKERNRKTRFELYEHCAKLIAFHRGANTSSTNLALDIGCGSFEANANIYQELNRLYFGRSTMWIGVDSSFSMLSFARKTEQSSRANLIKDSFVLDINNLSALRNSVSFNICASVSMLQWLLHSRLDEAVVLRNLNNLFSAVHTFLDSDSYACFQFYPDCYENILNIFKSLANLRKRATTTNDATRRHVFHRVFLYYSNPHKDDSRKLFLCLYKQ
jgi:SAM-dependent methyltransferase